MDDENVSAAHEAKKQIDIPINLPQALLDAIDQHAAEFGGDREVLIEKVLSNMAKDFFGYSSNTD